MSDVTYATPDDVADIWKPIPDDQQARVTKLLLKASARLRQKCPFDIDARLALFAADPTDPNALDPMIVADVTANIVKRVLVNPDGVVASSETAGPFSHSQTFGSRTATSSSIDNNLSVLDSDIDELRAARPAILPSTIRVHPGRAAHGFADGDPWRERRLRFGWPTW